MKTPTIHYWKEPIDDVVFAAVAFCEQIHRGDYYAFSVYLIVPRTLYWKSYEWEDLVHKHLVQVLHDKHHGHIPYIGRAADQDL